MKIYILTFVDLNNVGYNPKGVEVFKTREEAVKRMVDAFKAKGGKNINTATMIDDNCDNYSYAYIFGEYYWDIFEKEI